MDCTSLGAWDMGHKQSEYTTCSEGDILLIALKLDVSETRLTMKIKVFKST
jgi:hypothetical protein